jgi:uncharacterized protein (DUF1499 family)
MARLAYLVLALALALMAYIRLAPVDPARWHRIAAATMPGDQDMATGYRATRRITAPGAEVLQTLDHIASATPRTRVIAGAVSEGMITYETRSRIWGFPDYTTIAIQGDLLLIHARLRYGGSDMGVNRARVQDWLQQLGPLTMAP